MSLPSPTRDASGEEAKEESGVEAAGVGLNEMFPPRSLSLKWCKFNLKFAHLHHKQSVCCIHDLRCNRAHVFYLIPLLIIFSAWTNVTDTVELSETVKWGKFDYPKGSTESSLPGLDIQAAAMLSLQA